MKRLLQETCKEVSPKAHQEAPSDSIAFVNLQKRYRNILTRGKKELPIIPTQIQRQAR
ncbi:MAG: hypothetical protein KIT59_04470 [Nitrosomonas sp.]|nr:hypothetical protein [Nitrosomonas sp.]